MSGLRTDMRAVLFLLSLFFVFSCNSSVTEKAEMKNVNTKPEIFSFVKSKVFTVHTPSTNYSVYVPADYDSTKAKPLVFFFDPHADGALPLEKYKELSEKFGFTFIGSNNIKNGMAINDAISIANETLLDAVTKIGVDKSRIYVCGFSGGANVASALAVQFSGIAGLIACSGGGLQNTQPPNFLYVSIAGLNDFNYNSLATANAQLEQNNIPFLFLTGDYKHEWAPIELMQKAFTYFELHEKPYRTNSKIVSDAKKYFVDEIAVNKNDAMKELELMQQAVVICNEIGNTNGYKKRIAEIKNSKTFKKKLVEEARIKDYEKQAQQSYLQSLQRADVEYWKKEIDRLKDRSSNNTDIMQKQLNNRLLGYVGILCYSYCNQVVKQNNFAAAKNLLEIYRYAEPDNAEACFLSAQAYACNNLRDEAKEFLKCALKNKMDNTNRIAEDTSLKVFLNNNEIANLLHQ